MECSLPQLEALFHQALDVPASERGDFLDQACGGDAGLRREVQLLIDQTSGQTPGQTSGQTPGQTSGQTPGQTSGQTPGQISGHASDLAPGQGSGGARLLRAAIATELKALTSLATRGLVGQRVGPYVLTRLLGEGGMGAVYLGERDQAEFGHRVAIKVLSHALASAQAIARFRDERRILAALEHPHIVRLLDGGSTPEGLPYLVMEYLEGTTITHHAQTRRLTVRDRVTLIRKVCAALQYAHQNLVVHRDVKPSNILVGTTGEPKVLDFGIAKLLSPVPGLDREAQTRTGLGLFTPEYASPEQVRGEAVSTATDVYALGAVLYELVAGRPPHRGPENRLELMKRICEQDPPAPSAVAAPELRRSIGADLDNIILKALHRDVAHRYASMAHLSEDLGRFLAGLPVSAHTATLGYRARRFVQRNRATVLTAGLIAATLMGATAVSLRQAQRADEQAAHAQAERGRAVDAAARAHQETERARAAEARVQKQLAQLRAEQAARAQAEAEAQASSDQAELRGALLQRALEKAEREKQGRLIDHASVEQCTEKEARAAQGSSAQELPAGETKKPAPQPAPPV